MLLPGVTREQACVTGESLRNRVLSLALPHPNSAVDPHLTISVGVASTEPALGGRVADLVDAADRALYAAKQKGRNRVEC